MKIENQVVSLELAKEMKVLGFPQDSFWSWQLHKKWKTKQLILSMAKTKPEIFDFYSALTVAEMGEALPRRINGYKLTIYLLQDGWDILYYHYKEKHNLLGIEIQEEKFSDAMAKMWIYLKKEGLL